MRFLLIIVLTLFVFTANQAAAAFEQCSDISCAGSLSVDKKAEDSKDPCCPPHCAMNGHHNLAIPQLGVMLEPASVGGQRDWPARTALESITAEGLIEPPSLA